MITFDDFLKVDIRTGRILEAAISEKAKKPAIKMTIDFGELGVKRSSAQITDHYNPEALIGKTILAVVNFPPRQIADVLSEVLVLGVYDPKGVVLVVPDKEVEAGLRLL